MEISIRRNTGNYWSGGSFGSATEVWSTTSLSAGNWSYTFPASNLPADDTYTIRVRATDNVSLVETPNSRSFTYDTAAPDTSITANPADPTTSTSASFSFTSTEGSSTFECQLDGGGYSSCTSPKSYAGPLSEGSHTFLVRSTDPAGNTDGSAASYTWTVDTTAPSSTSFSRPPAGATRLPAGTRAARRTASAAPTPTARAAPASRTWRSRSARARATTGVPALSARAARSGTRQPLPAETGPTPSLPRASRPTAPTRFACGRPTTSTSSRPLRAARSRSTTSPPTRRSTPIRRTRRRPRTRASPSARLRGARPSSARSTAAATPRARARRATRASPKAATPSSSGPPTSPVTLTARPRATRGRSTPWRRARRRASPPPRARTTPRAGTRAAGRSASAAHTPTPLGRAEGGDLHPPGRGQLLERNVVRQRQRGLPDRVARGRQLVVRLPGVELPRGRLLHDPRQGDGQRDERRDAGEPELHVRRDEPERALHVPGLGRRL